MADFNSEIYAALTKIPNLNSIKEASEKSRREVAILIYHTTQKKHYCIVYRGPFITGGIHANFAAYLEWYLPGLYEVLNVKTIDLNPTLDSIKNEGGLYIKAAEDQDKFN